jgi:hypothetical protein
MCIAKSSTSNRRVVYTVAPEYWSIGVLELGSTANRPVSILRLMSTLPNVRDLLEGHIVLELESIDRLYLNGYVPQLQYGPGLVGFLCQHRGQPIASPALLGQITGWFSKAA